MSNDPEPVEGPCFRVRRAKPRIVRRGGRARLQGASLKAYSPWDHHANAPILSIAIKVPQAYAKSIMNKLKRNESGFGTVETLLVIVIVAVLGFVGWYVYKQKNSKTPKETSSDTAQQAAKDKDSSSASKAAASCTAPAEYTAYTNTEIGYCFVYPTAWGTVTLHPGVINPAYEPAGAYWGSFSANANASFGHVKTDWTYSGPGRGGPINAMGFTVYEMFTPHESTPSTIRINNADKVLVATNSIMDIEGAIVKAQRRFTETPNYAGMSFQLNVPSSGSFDPYADSPSTLVTEAQFVTMETILNSVIEL